MFGKCGLRNVHEQLLVRIRAQLWFQIQPLSPRFLAYFRSGSWRRLVQCIDCIEVDLLVNVILNCWREVVRMIMSAVGMVVTVAVAMTGVLIVTM